MTNTMTHAERELEILAQVMPDNLVTEFAPEILALCEKFGLSGQSGGSAPYTAAAISQAVRKLCLQETIAPLTGEDSEWAFGHMNETMFQNVREGAVFKDGKGGKPYYLDAIVWKGEDEWDQFSGSVEGIYSRNYIKSFPFKPKRFYIDVYRVPYDPSVHKESDATTCGDGDYVYLIKNKEQLNQVWEYYDKFDKPIKA